MQPGTSSRATLSLILGILGLVLCGIFTAIPAWILGHQELKDIDMGLAPEGGRALAQVGMILGIIGVAIGALGCLVGLGYLMLIAGFAASIGGL